jgi:hypothetical protein
VTNEEMMGSRVLWGKTFDACTIADVLNAPVLATEKMSNFVEVPRAWDIERGYLMVDKLEVTQENIDGLSKDIKRLKIQLTKKKKMSCKGFDEYLRC